MDVDDVLAFVETGAVDGSLTVADGARVIGATVDVTKGIPAVNVPNLFLKLCANKRNMENN